MTRLLTRTGASRLTPDDVDALVRYTAHLSPIVRALTATAGRETMTGRWLVPSRGDATTWTRFLPSLGEPPLLTDLRSVIPHTDRVSAAATICQQSPARTTLGLPPRRSLQAALTLAQRQRPPTPGNRPQLGSPSVVRAPARNAL